MPPVPAAEGLTHRQILTILSGLMTGMFLAALDQNIVGTAIKTIADELHGLSAQAWVTTAYLITSTIATPLYGKLSDIYGRKKFFMAAITIFIIGSAMCSFAASMYQLAAFRAVQGIGAGGLFSLALAIVGDIVPPRERAKYQGYFLAVFGTSSVLGPIIGGFFAGADSILGITGWRWVFLVNVPVGLVALFIVARTLHVSHFARPSAIDWWGAFTLVVGVVPLLLVAEQGREWGWTSPNSLTAYAIGVAGLIAFIWVETRMGNAALIPMRIFKDRTIAIALGGGVVVGSGMFGGMLVIPLYLQIVHGATPMDSGFQMLPMVLGMMIASVVSGQLMTKTGKVRIFPIVGVLLMVIALLMLSRISADSDLRGVMALMFLFGLGLGNTMQPLTLAVQAVVDPRDMGMATSAATFFRQMGGTLGVAVFLSVLFNSVGDNIKNAFVAAAKDSSFVAALSDPAVLANPTNKAFVTALSTQDTSAFGNVLADSSVINALDPRLAHPFKVGFATSMDLVFLLGAIVCAAGLVILLFMPEVHLSSRSAQQRAADDAAARAAGVAGPTTGAQRTVTHDLVDAVTVEAGGHSLDELPDAGEASQTRPRS
ncbi:MAG TPA: MDR family MFS transporter [Dermatophilaceae bacterium]|nr:MDR family MFS transporter [Dermatophilaceae bacterium]HOR16850.1 MDR family MFS transporter [Dermatophilaceae bacterium]HOV01959.1 MDR family MFS transporter [Dermatophilaceae bacterium]HPK90786.1 MDR family MFS transporter [Dermatophilaceae bacterium]HQG11771.1 MDR family MFS transporter [Dermatophilaceae bacterium]